MKLNLEQLIRALSCTVDLVGVDEIQHGKRVAFMALVCAGIAGFDNDETTMLFRIGLLHDCGVSSTKVHKQLIDELDWIDSDTHCRIGERRLRQFAPFASMADAVRYHHTRWPILKSLPLPEKTKIHANLIYLLDRVDALTALQPGHNRLAQKDKIRQKIESLSHTYFKPELVEIFLTASENEAFWITMEPFYLESFLRKAPTGIEEILLNDEGLLTMAGLFAQVVDAKSPYTAEHSFGVASLASFLAEKCSLSPLVCKQIEVAALLHDLGKLQIPDTILESQAPLPHEGWAIMRHHSFVTYQILKNITGMEKIALWASNHHEKLDGTGYPFRRTAAELTVESRIIVIADIFQALAQNRPYRASQSPGVIVDILKKGVADQKLDAELVRIVESESLACYAIATHPQQTSLTSPPL